MKAAKSLRQSGSTAICLRAVVGWIVANLACEIFALRHPENYLRVRYEDLVHSPHVTITKIYEWISLAPYGPLDILLRAGVDNRHQLYGNAMRFRAFSPSELKEDIAWRREMSGLYRTLVAALCWPFGRRYGYI